MILTSKVTARISSFPPVIGHRPRVLILGSIPGVASLVAQEYYAMPRNAFWPIMGELFGARFELAYQQRLDVLTASRVALWDVLGSCVRPGSLDSSIDTHSAAVNDFSQMLTDHPTIQRIFFNGKKAAEMYRRYVLPLYDSITVDIPCSTLPSTSPAHAAMSFGEKLSAWSIVCDAASQA